MRERRFGDLTREGCLVARPIAEARSEAVHGYVLIHPAHDHIHRHRGERSGRLQLLDNLGGTSHGSEHEGGTKFLNDHVA
jgi:hypothetical protein